MNTPLPSRPVSSRRGRPTIDAYLVECLDCRRRFRLTDRTCPGCGTSVDKAFPLYRKAVAAVLLVAAIGLSGCLNTPTPTEPHASRITLTARPDCAFVAWSEPAIDQPAQWIAYKDGVPAFSGTMTTQGHTIGAANFKGQFEVAVTYRGQETRAAMECGR